jgi:uncharacterized membrane protein (DUF106 family)
MKLKFDVIGPTILVILVVSVSTILVANMLIEKRKDEKMLRESLSRLRETMLELNKRIEEE